MVNFCLQFFIKTYSKVNDSSFSLYLQQTKIFNLLYLSLKNFKIFNELAILCGLYDTNHLTVVLKPKKTNSRVQPGREMERFGQNSSKHITYNLSFKNKYDESF